MSVTESHQRVPHISQASSRVPPRAAAPPCRAIIMPEYSELANWDGALSNPPNARTNHSPYYRYPPQGTGDVLQVPAARSQCSDARSSSSLQPRASPLPHKYTPSSQPSSLNRPTPQPVHTHPRLPSSQVRVMSPHFICSRLCAFLANRFFLFHSSISCLPSPSARTCPLGAGPAHARRPHH